MLIDTLDVSEAIAEGNNVDDHIEAPASEKNERFSIHCHDYDSIRIANGHQRSEAGAR
jgi:hypothetical protein